MGNERPQPLKTEVFKTLYKALNTNNAITKLVGGCVRDYLQQKPLSDIDLATTLHPEEASARLKALGFHIVPIGLSHGTILATKDGQKFEITTLRKDISTDGRHAEVAFTTDFEEDAGRRDFTFNALYMDDQYHITDYFGGADDLAQSKVRFVGAPSKRLVEDWLRALRYFRFYARFANPTPPDDETLYALQNAAPHMATLSAERKTSEFLKIMAAPNPEAACALMQSCGFIAALGLEKFDLAAFEKWRKTSAPALESWGAKNIGLLNFIAATWKPTRPLRSIELLSQNPHFIFSNAEKQLIKNLAPYHMRHLNDHHPHFTAHKLGAEAAQILYHLAALHSYDSRPVPTLTPPDPLPFTGADLQAHGMADGKALGGTLAELHHWGAWHAKTQKADYLTHLKTLEKNPATVLVIPDIHGNLGGLQALLKSPEGKAARAIISLGDYLDASEEDPEKTRIIDTAEFIFDLLEADHRFIMVRANHEQINAKLMRHGLLHNKLLGEFITPNKHNLLFLKELKKLSRKQQFSFMARQFDMFVQRSVDGLRLMLPSGEVLAFTHGGWHVDILNQTSVFDTFHIGAHRLEALTFNTANMPKHARYEALWGHWLAVPDDQARADTAHLNLPPAGHTLVVGHHFTRRKNTLPEKMGNIIFADTGSGKGGQLAALQIHLDESRIDVLAPQQKGGFKATPLHTTPHIAPFTRRIPNT